jgi:hypothetical protein
MPVAPRSIWLGSSAAVAIATAAALLVVLTGDYDETEARTLGTVVAALLGGGAALAALELLARRVTVPGAVVLAGAGAAFLLTTVGLWKFGYVWGYASGFETETPDDWFKLVPIGLAWSTALVLGAATLLLARDAHQPAAIAVSVVSAAWATAVTALVWAEAGSALWIKLVGGLAVLTVGGFLFAPLSQRAHRPS